MSTTPATALQVLVKAVYRHFQGDLIQVVRIVEHSETSEELVLYSNVNIPGIWRVLPVSEFVGHVDGEPRFSLTDIRISTLGGMMVTH